MKQEVRKHRVMKMSLRDELILFFDQFTERFLSLSLCKRIFPGMNWRRRDKFMKMYFESKERY